MPTSDHHLDHKLTGSDDRSGVVGKPAEAEPFDREISLRGIAWSAGGLVAVVLLSALVVWFVLRDFREADKKADPPPSPIAAANEQAPPPEPRLQTSPEQELRDVRAEEDLRLSGANVNPAQGATRIPIDVAMEVIAARGLGPEIVGGNPAAAAPVAENAEKEGTR